jgi:hypothetical protein
MDLKWVSIWKKIDFNGFSWIEMGFNMEKLIWILYNGFRWIEIDFHMQKTYVTGFRWI